VTLEELKSAVETATGVELEETEFSHLFGEEKELTDEMFYGKFFDIRVLFRKKPEPTTTIPAPEPPPPESDDIDDENDGLDDDETLEPEAVDEELTSDDKNDSEESKPGYSEETQKLIEEANKQREQLRETTDKIYDLEAKIRDAENFLNFEYGPDQAWAPLKGQCPEMNQAQYTYRLCLFDRAIQKEKNGHNEIGLGNWRGGEGAEADKYSVQKYADGQHCWNGPARSTVIHVECGEELELFDVKEPAKCEYEFKLRSPAACPDPASLPDAFALHTEL